MSRELSIRPFAPDEWRTYRDLRLRALADSPDAFGSSLALERDRPDPAWQARLVSADESRWALPLVAEVAGEPAGLAFGLIDPPGADLAHLYQMWVAPEARGMGAGRMLLDAVIDWARSANASALELGVTCGDTPARRLYERAGFQPVAEPAVFQEGSELLGQLMQLELRAREA